MSVRRHFPAILVAAALKKLKAEDRPANAAPAKQLAKRARKARTELTKRKRVGGE